MTPGILDKTEVLPFRLSDAFIDGYRRKRPPFGFNGLGELVYLRTYSRLKEDGINEKWFETVRRVVEGTYSMQKRWIYANNLGWSDRKAQRSAQEMYDRMWSMKFLPPGRGLWAMGSPLTEERGLFAALFNCAMVSTAKIEDEGGEVFSLVMDMSMLGIGVGFDTRGEGKATLHAPDEGIENDYQIPDTREGWVESVRMLIDTYLKPNQGELRFDYSLVRQAGEPIKGFGGVSAGPEPLMLLHGEIKAILDRELGKAISKTAIVDIMNQIGKCVVAGNVRRTALLALGDMSQEYLDLKNYEVNPHREAYGWTSNNSVAAELGMDYTDAARRIATNGEPGFLWLQNIHENARMGDLRADDKRVVGCNPCITADTWVMTSIGPRTAGELVGVRFDAVVNGRAYPTVSDGFFFTGVKDVLRLRTEEGFELTLTPNHEVQCRTPTGLEWKTAGSLQRGDEVVLNNHRGMMWGGSGTATEGWLLGSMVGDGSRTDNSAILEYWGPTKEVMLRGARARLMATVGGRSDCGSGSGSEKYDRVKLTSTGVAILADRYYLSADKDLARSHIERTSQAFYAGFLQGWFDADGSVQGSTAKGISVRLSSSHRSNLQVAQRMLARLGIVGRIYARRDAELRLLPDGRGGSKAYQCQANFDLVIARDNLQPFAEIIGFSEPEKSTKLVRLLGTYRRQPNREGFVARIKDILPAGRQEVYDVTVSEVHAFDGNGVMCHNCGEIELEDGELCNVVETFPENHESLEDYQRTLKFSYLYAKTVTLSKSPWRKTNRVMLRNRRVGISQSGIQQFIASHGLEQYKHWSLEGYKTLEYYDRVYSEWLAIPRSKRLTTTKPSGTVSLLAGATPGVHWPESRHYIRRVRLAAQSPLVGPLEKAGYPMEPAFGDEQNTIVVEIPISIGAKVRTVGEVSMWEQLAMGAFVAKYWADNMVSQTVTFDPTTEGPQIAAALEYYQYQLKSVSFLPRMEAGAYRQMPYEAITADEYAARAAALKPVRFGTQHEDAEQERFCDSSGCAI